MEYIHSVITRKFRGKRKGASGRKFLIEFELMHHQWYDIRSKRVFLWLIKCAKLCINIFSSCWFLCTIDSHFYELVVVLLQTDRNDSTHHEGCAAHIQSRGCWGTCHEIAIIFPGDIIVTSCSVSRQTSRPSLHTRFWCVTCRSRWHWLLGSWVHHAQSDQATNWPELYWDRYISDCYW